jgi:hypothetical protein
LLAATTAGLGLVASMAACGTTRVPAGADADDPACADVVLGAPETMLDQPQVSSSSQGTVVWGDGEDAIVLRCGVTPPGPTTDPCTTLSDADENNQVDWIVRDDEETGIVRYTTFGRSPAIDLTVPRSVAGDQPSAVPLDLAALVLEIPATDRCLGPGDA